MKILVSLRRMSSRGTNITLHKLISTAFEIFAKRRKRLVAPARSSYSSVGSCRFYMRYSLLLRVPRNYLNEPVHGGGKLGGDSLTLVTRYQSDAERASRRRIPKKGF